MWKQVSEPKLELLISNPECDCLDAHVTSVGLPTAADTPFSLGRAFQASDVRSFPFPCLMAAEDLAGILNCFIEMEVMYHTIHPFKVSFSGLQCIPRYVQHHPSQFQYIFVTSRSNSIL